MSKHNLETGYYEKLAHLEPLLQCAHCEDKHLFKIYKWSLLKCFDLSLSYYATC